MGLLRCVLLLLTATILASAFALQPPDTATSTTPNYDEDGPAGKESGDVTIDGVPLNELSPEELDIYLDDLDAILVADLDINVLKQEFAAEQSKDVAQIGLRKKRWITLAGRALFTAGRALFRGASRLGKPKWKGTKSGPVLTQQYTKSGSFRDAVRDFHRFKPTDVQKYPGLRTGRIGNHQIKVRPSSGGQPTVEIISPKGGHSYIRKFRYGPTSG